MRLFVAFLLLLAALPIYAQLTCADIDGASILSQEDEPQFLGFFGSDFALDSVFNDVGRYGSNTSSTSVFNDVSMYGSAVSSFSAFNDIASQPPAILKGGKVVAHLTTNDTVLGGVSMQAIQSSCEFFGSFPDNNLEYRGFGPGGFDTSLNGAWWNPDRSGEGLIVDMVDRDGTGDYVMVFYFYTYDLNGAPLYLVGSDNDYDLNGVAVAEMRSTSGAFWGDDFRPEDVVRADWGTFTITFLNCGQLTVEYSSVVDGYGEGELALERFFELRPGQTCP